MSSPRSPFAVCTAQQAGADAEDDRLLIVSFFINNLDWCQSAYRRRQTALGGRLRLCPPRCRNPHDTNPAPSTTGLMMSLDGRKTDVLLSVNGPSTARCRQDITVYPHRHEARPGRPYPVPACNVAPPPGHSESLFTWQPR